jgi:hypothetical protein
MQNLIREARDLQAIRKDTAGKEKTEPGGEPAGAKGGKKSGGKE